MDNRKKKCFRQLAHIPDVANPFASLPAGRCDVITSGFNFTSGEREII